MRAAFAGGEAPGFRVERRRLSFGPCVVGLRASPSEPTSRPVNTGILPHGPGEARFLTLLFHRSGLRPPRRPTTPSADFCVAIGRPCGLPSPRGRRRRSPGVSPASFLARPSDLRCRPLMDMDFAISCPLVRPTPPHIRFLFVRPRVRSTLPSDGPSRSRPCVSLVLHLHQVAQGTPTPKTPDMPGTQDAAPPRRPPGGGRRPSLTVSAGRSCLRPRVRRRGLTRPAPRGRRRSPVGENRQAQRSLFEKGAP